MKALNVLFHIMLTGIVLTVFEKEIAEISILVREKPFETFVVIGIIILLINSIIRENMFKF